jgi:hypothetical protein
MLPPLCSPFVDRHVAIPSCFGFAGTTQGWHIEGDGRLLKDSQANFLPIPHVLFSELQLSATRYLLPHLASTLEK